MFRAEGWLLVALASNSFAKPAIQARDPQATITADPAAPSCAAGCMAHVEPVARYTWQSYVYNTTITAATLEIVTYPKVGNDTRTMLRYGDIPEGYEAPERDVGGTVISRVTLDYGNGEYDETYVTYPSTYVDFPRSAWWTGVKETAVSGTAQCATETSPATIRMPTPSIVVEDNPDLLTIPTEPRVTGGPDGTGFMLVRAGLEAPAVDALPPFFENIAQCRMDTPKPASIPAETTVLTGAFFTTITTSRLETNCKPDVMCAVRTEYQGTGGLAAPTAAPGAEGNPAIEEQASMIAEQGENGPVVEEGVSLLRVRPEKTATLFITPTPLKNQLSPSQSQGGSNEPIKADGAPQPEGNSPSTPQITPPPIVSSGGLPLGSVSVAGEEIPVALLPPSGGVSGQGVHVEQKAQLLQIGSTTAHLGETVTIKDRLVAVTEAADGSRVAVVQEKAAPGQPATTNRFVLAHDRLIGSDGSGGALVDSIGNKLPSPANPIAAALDLENDSPVTVGGVVLTPQKGGGYVAGGTTVTKDGKPTVIGGTTLTKGGSITMPARAGVSGSPASRAATLTLTTDAEGNEVVGVDGKSSTFFVYTTKFGTKATGTPQVGASPSGDKPSAAARNLRLDVSLYGVSLILTVSILRACL